MDSYNAHISEQNESVEDHNYYKQMPGQGFEGQI